jgi:CDP-glucose 4,6-dehydratase
VRPWQHVLDPVAGYVALAARLLAGEGKGFAEGWNFGPDPSADRTMVNMVEEAARLWSSEAQWQRDTAAHVHEATFR